MYAAVITGAILPRHQKFQEDLITVLRRGKKQLDVDRRG